MPPASRSRPGYARQQQLVTALRSPARYPHPVRAVRLYETHISWVLLAGRFAYKIKKALNLGFLDARRLSARRAYCNEEMRLNRRLAPQLYLDTVAIGGTPASPRFGARPAIEYAVRMRRFNPSRTLDRLASRNLLQASHIAALAQSVATFHLGLDQRAPGTAEEYCEHFHAAMLQNFSQLAALPGAAGNSARLDALQQASMQAFQAQRDILQQRWRAGFVRECHGDLHLGNIVLIGKEPTPFDGIDFNPALRWIDVMDEVAFLFMDLLHHKQPQLAYRFLNTYLEHTGDYVGLALLNFYAAYRATVRAKVGAIRAEQLTSRKRQFAMTTCRDYLSLANALLEPRRAALIITCGLPGSGKSRFARLASERWGAIRLRSDVERKRLFGLGALENSRSEQNIYSPEATQRTYAHLLATAQSLLRAGHTVIVDAAFLKQDERRMFARLAEQSGVPFGIAALHADDATLRARILHRQSRADDASEADIAVLEKLQNAQEPLSPQELRDTVIFFNTEDESAWSDLQDLLMRTPHRNG